MPPSSPLIAHVIPSLRLPRSLEYFDYTVPEQLRASIHVGSIVRIRFRHQRLLGIVVSLDEKTTHQATKPVDGLIHGFNATAIQRELIRTFAEQFFVAPATVVNMIWAELPRTWRGAPLTPVEREQTHNQPVSVLWSNDAAATNAEIQELLNTSAKRNDLTAFIAPEIRGVKEWAEKLHSYRPLVIHKQLPRQLYWERISQLNGHPDDRPLIVIGTRSALFFPWPRLDQLIINQEENTNHRQSEMNPRFHSTQVAELLRQSAGSRTMVTTTVPLVTTYQRLATKVWQLIDRRSDHAGPTITRVDLLNERKVGNYSMLSETLQLQLQRTLSEKKTSLLFLNRKGEGNALACQDCGRGFPCPRCQKPLVPHRQPKQAEALLCHLCGHSEEAPAACPTCGGVRFSRTGWRLQKLLEEVRGRFPDATVSLVESGAPKPAAARSDIIIGTQLLLRPEFLGSASLVAAILADQLLAFPDYSSPEKTFRLLTQTALDMKKGSSFIIQTFRTDHPAIALAGSGRWSEYYEQEIQQRQAFGYPPKLNLLRLILKGEKKNQVAKEAAAFHEQLAESIPTNSGIILHHPNPSFIAKVRGVYRWEMVLKYPTDQWTIVQKLVQCSSEKWLIDLNPLDLL